MVYNNIIIMKYYIHTPIKTGLFNDTSVLDEISEYIEKEEYSTFVYGDNGIYHIENDKFFKVQINENQPVQRVDNYMDKYTLFIDNTYISRNKEQTYCLPVNHVKNTIKKNYYSLNDKSEVKLVFVIDCESGRIKDFYFITNEPYDNQFIQEDICTFLSMIK